MLYTEVSRLSLSQPNCFCSSSCCLLLAFALRRTTATTAATMAIAAITTAATVAGMLQSQTTKQVHMRAHLFGRLCPDGGRMD